MGILDEAVALAEDTPYVKAVIHGDTGVGKTTLAANSPDPTFVDFERSTDTLRSNSEFDKIKILRPKTMKQVFDYSKAAVGNFGTIAFDTVTSMQLFYMREFMLKVESDSKGGRDKFLPYQGDYRYATNELTDFFLFLQEAPINVIFLAHSDYVQNEQGTVVRIQPTLTPRVWSNLKAFISVVAYLEKSTTGLGANAKVVRKLYLNSTNIIVAKNRLGIQETYIENPNFKELFKQ